MRKSFFIIGVIILLAFISSSHAQVIVFDNPGSQYLNITLPYEYIRDISFNISGSNYTDSYAQNVTLDILDDGLVDWSYNPYHSNTTFHADSVLYAYSSINNADIDFYNISKDIGFWSLKTLGEGTGQNFLKRADVQNSTLGIISTSSIDKQIVLLMTNFSPMHLFVPSISEPLAGAWGLYIAQGGSTYYCNSNHTFSYVSRCNLSAQEAMIPQHLAAEANQTDFSHQEIFKSPAITSAINYYLDSCENPCNVPLKLTSSSAGIINLNEFDIINPYLPAEISISQNATDYFINITSSTNITNVSYFYGVMPNVYVLPVIAADDSPNLTENESMRIQIINNTLPQAWDNLTNFSHPLNFTFAKTPYRLTNYLKNSSQQAFENNLWNEVFPNLNLTYPAIIIILDIKDNLNISASNIKRYPGTDYGIISEIYMPGLSQNSTLAELERENEEVFLNLLLHELAHSFIAYPAPDEQRKFHSNHPASFADLPDFSTYSSSQSPTSQESYYEIYSIMNQIRPYLTNQILNNTPIELSPLDKMLLGILSPDIENNYTFYASNITRSQNRYLATNVSALNHSSTKNLYESSLDSNWWDVRTDSPPISVGTNISFKISKADQRNRALWIFAQDEANKNHFQTFNINASSLTTDVLNFTSLVGRFPSLRINSQINALKKYNRLDKISFNISSSKPLVQCNFTLDGGSTNHTLSAFNSTYWYLENFSVNLTEKQYTVNFRCADTEGYVNETSQLTFYIDNPPNIDLDYSEWDTYQTTNLSDYRTSELQNLTNITFANSLGLIKFVESINVSRNIDLRDNIKIERNKVQINSSRIPEFNKSAEITFKEVNFTLPIVKKDGHDCSEEACLGKHFEPHCLSYECLYNETFCSLSDENDSCIEYSSLCGGYSEVCVQNDTIGNYYFNVTGFSEYTLAEQCLDGIKNYDEIGPDCGGSCSACTVQPTENPSSGGSSSSGGAA